MIAVLKGTATDQDIARIFHVIEGKSLEPKLFKGEGQTVIHVIGSDVSKLDGLLEADPAVERVFHISKPYKLASRDWHPEGTVIRLDNGLLIGGEEIVIIAGPCSVENGPLLNTTAEGVAKGGAHILRGGVFKPRSSPYNFQGLGREGLSLLKAARAHTGLPIITEVMTPSEVEWVSGAADILQIGTRNMQNFDLLKEVGKQQKPVMLKRGLASTIEEWLLSAEYILAQGNHQVMLCERGIRTFETATRNTLDLGSIALLKELTHLPILVDPSHATGKRSLVPAAARAAIAAGADGIMVEVHPNPDAALSDGAQSLDLAGFEEMVKTLGRVAASIDRRLASPVPPSKQ